MKNLFRSCSGCFFFLVRCVFDIWLPFELCRAIEVPPMLRERPVFVFGGFCVVCGWCEDCDSTWSTASTELGI